VNQGQDFGDINNLRVVVTPTGNVGIGTPSPEATLHLAPHQGSPNVEIWIEADPGSGVTAFTRLRAATSNGVRESQLLFGGECSFVWLPSRDGTGGQQAKNTLTLLVNTDPAGNVTARLARFDSDVVLRNDQGGETIRLDRQAGDIRAANIYATGDVVLAGADCAEDFDIACAENVDVGTVMVIDHDGILRPSQDAYDKRVAGVISGAGDLRPGIVLDKRASQSGRLPLALVGKVYCKIDASHSPVEAGDLLTTSSTPTADGDGLVFNYTYTLPQFLRAIYILLTSIGALAPKTIGDYRSPLEKCLTRLSTVHDTIVSTGIVGTRVPIPNNIGWVTPSEPPDRLTWSSDWYDISVGEQRLWPYGAVERYSGASLVASYFSDFYEIDMDRLDRATQNNFVRLVQLRIAQQKKALYSQLGLPSVRQAINHLRSLIGQPPLAEPHYEDWSVKEALGIMQVPTPASGRSLLSVIKATPPFGGGYAFAPDPNAADPNDPAVNETWVPGRPLPAGLRGILIGVKERRNRECHFKENRRFRGVRCEAKPVGFGVALYLKSAPRGALQNGINARARRGSGALA
jgi:hypothetical protein